ncbi:MAG: T9SS type A sorting domain-containing protein [Bacteroidales bacterium]
MSLLISNVSYSQWSTDVTANTPVITDLNRQNSCRIASDGNGGAIIVWWDNDLATNDYNIYAQRLNYAGVVQWNSRGIPVCTNTAHQQNPDVTGDGNGNALITWFDQRNVKNEVYVQILGANGQVKWTTDGVHVGKTPDHYQQAGPVVTSDGNGGAIVAWEDWRGDFYNPVRSIRAQRISANGTIMWGDGGISLNVTDGGSGPRIISDGNGGAIIAWDQWTGVYPAGSNDVFIQKVSPTGSLQWGEHGINLCDLSNMQRFPRLTSDGNGGAIVAWEDNRNASYSTLYAQRINSSGVVQWAANGIRLTNLASGQSNQVLLPDGNGGAFIAWEFASGVSVLQRIASDGTLLWDNSGVSFSDLRTSRYPEMIHDNAGGIIITWQDGSYDIMAQRVSSSGSVQWAARGVWICYVSMEQYSPKLTTDGHGGAIIAWDDLRNTNTTSTDIYAQQVSLNGSLGVVTAIEKTRQIDGDITLRQNFPNPFSNTTKAVIKLDSKAKTSLVVYNISGKVVCTLADAVMEPGEYTFEFNSGSLPEGVYYIRLRSGSKTSTRTMVKMK